MAKIWDTLELNEELPLTEFLEHVSVIKQKWNIQDEDISVRVRAYGDDGGYIYLEFQREETQLEIQARVNRKLRYKEEERKRDLQKLEELKKKYPGA